MGEYCRIAPNVKLGQNVSIHAFVNLYGCSIGENSRVGAFVEIQKNASIGRNVKVSSHTFICEGVTIEDDVLSVTTYPSSTISILGLQQITELLRPRQTGLSSEQW